MLPIVSSNSILPLAAVYCDNISAPPNKPSFALMKFISQVLVKLPSSSFNLINSTGVFLPLGLADIFVT